MGDGGRSFRILEGLDSLVVWRPRCTPEGYRLVEFLMNGLKVKAHTSVPGEIEHLLSDADPGGMPGGGPPLGPRF